MATKFDKDTAESDLQFYRVDQRYKSLRTAIRTAGVVGAIWFGGEALAPLAGQNTALQLGLSLIGDLKFTLAIALTGSAVAWGAVERHLRHKKTEYLQNRVKELEAQIDPNRSSSGLTTKGKTNPRDRRS